MSVCSCPETDPWRQVVAGFVVFWPCCTFVVPYCTICSVFSGWVCHASLHLSGFFVLIPPGHVLLWTQMFFSRKQSSVRNAGVLCPPTKRGRSWQNIHKRAILLLPAVSACKRLRNLWFPSSYSLKVGVQVAHVRKRYVLGILWLTFSYPCAVEADAA